MNPLIPENRQAAVERALLEAFGVDTFDDIEPLTAGLSSALIFKIIVKDRPYLLRVIMRTDAMGDPTIQFTCMAPAAEAGLAPHIWYTSIEDRISITDFVVARPMPFAASAILIADTLKQLHSLPPFPNRMNYLVTMDGFVQKFSESQILPKRLAGDVFEQYERIKSVYPQDDPENFVSCHNDLKPENILFDGERVWLVDWEAGFLNDRYADLSVVGNFVVTNDADEKAVLTRYFGDTPGEYRHARFYLMTQLMHVFYLVVFMRIAVAAGESVDPDAIVPDFRDFHNRMRSGEIDLVGSAEKMRYARVHLQQVLKNVQTARFEEALRVLAGRIKEM